VPIACAFFICKSIDAIIILVSLKNTIAFLPAKNNRHHHEQPIEDALPFLCRNCRLGAKGFFRR
jgi:hypothetical protein